MDTKQITIRAAKKDDDTFIAEAVLNAVGLENITESHIHSIAPLCAYDKVLYSWRNTLIAEYDNQIAGALIGYAGKDYLILKALTIHLMSMEGMPFYNPEFAESFKTMIPETKPGEYYIDSVYVKPESRNLGIATALIKDSIQAAKKLGLGTITLAVAPENHNAQQLYSSLGFKNGEQEFIFGEWYTKMIYNF